MGHDGVHRTQKGMCLFLSMSGSKSIYAPVFLNGKKKKGKDWRGDGKEQKRDNQVGACFHSPRVSLLRGR